MIATWAGNPTPTASDYLRLFALGSAGDEFDDVVIGWTTPNAAAGELPLLLPAELPAGWYELRLPSPAPGSSLPVPIARSEPTRIDGSIAPPPPPGSSCDDDAACDDGDPCTEDACVPGVGCVSTPASSFARVTCTCRRGLPAACADQRLPPSIGRACGLFDDAAGATDRTQRARRLRQGVRALKDSLTAAAKRRKRGISRDCAGASKAALRDAKDRAERLLGTLRQPRR